ncbi:TMEM175 family protein [Dactylosporangium darangshiense]|uniref:TMEM175 family protein n=1 Tax=Dactylosporangium darangshiense TaxID=579108 RepID=A0ABP8DRZ9_9ACTN
MSEEAQGTEVVAKAVAAERLTFFADAVIAIAITLLALELPVPVGATNRELLHSVGEHRHEYLAFLISFLVIGAHWTGHHRVFRWVESLGGRLGLLSLGWLFLLVITPYATRVLNGDGAFEARFVFYAAVQAATGGVFALMVHQIRKHRLYREGTPETMFAHARAATLSLSAGFLVSIPVAFVTHWSYVCWMAVPWLGNFTSRLMNRRRLRAAAVSP